MIFEKNVKKNYEVFSHGFKQLKDFTHKANSLLHSAQPYVEKGNNYIQRNQ